MNHKRIAITLTGAVWTLGASLAVGFAVSPATHAHVAPTSAQAISDDDPAWDCTRDGNRVCGPASGKAAGCYSDAGDLVAPWPCEQHAGVGTVGYVQQSC